MRRQLLPRKTNHNWTKTNQFQASWFNQDMKTNGKSVGAL